jgi:hypothetical protein
MSDARTVTLARKGRWMGAYGVARCPAHEDRNPSLSLADGHDGRLLVYCHAGCDFLAIMDALRAQGLVTDRGARPLSANAHRELVKRHEESNRRRAIRAKWAWDESSPIHDTLAEAYLRGRGITCPLPPTLRHHPNCLHPTGRRLPAMVAHVEGVEDFAIHRTYLRADGSGKASVEPPKAMLGKVAGGAVRVAVAPVDATTPLVVAEGIETALSLASGLIAEPATIWAALSAPGMARPRLPREPGSLLIASDGDTAGREAADALTRRARNEGWSVRLMPAPDRSDWNDVLLERRAVA